jgi:hypothetical protein
MMLYWYTGVMMLRVDDSMNNQVRYCYPLKNKRVEEYAALLVC